MAATFYLNPASAMVGVLDFTDVESRKYFHKATKRLDSEELYENDDLLGLRSDIQHERESR